MRRSRADPCVLLRKMGDVMDGMVLLQADDSLGLGTPTFLTEEEEASKVFTSKLRVLIASDITTFNGLDIVRWKCETFSTTQPERIGKLASPTDQKDFASRRALAQYVGICVRPDV